MRAVLPAIALLAAIQPALASPYALEGSVRGGAWGDALVADGATLLTTGGNTAQRLDPVTRQVLASYALPEAYRFPRALAVRGDDVLIGGFASEADSGHGVVHVLDTGTGVVRLTLTSPVPDRNDFFGSGIAVLGDRVVVGAPGEQRAYLFDGATGDLLRTLEDPSGSEQFASWFGGAVAAAGGQVWVTASRIGLVYRFDPDTGELAGTIVASPSYGDGSLASAGGDVLVGDPAAPGEVRRYDGATGALLQTYGAPPAPGFGPGALAADDTVVVVGDSGAGAVHVFDRASGAFLATIANPTPWADPDEDGSELFGRALAVVGGRIAVGDPVDRLPAGPSGSIYLFDDVAGCGDGTIAGHEACDDGNTVSGDGCDANCRPSGCGNGVAAGDEACDDGNTVGGDGCDQNCQPTGCGNGAVTTGEECDDGGRVSGDGCSPACRVERCGNGILDPGETCDDANEDAGDGCDACSVETRDAFSCYGVRRSDATRARLVVHDEAGVRAVAVGRPVAVCLGDGLTQPAAELTCYRARATRPPRRDDTVADTVATTDVQMGAWRTLCLPSDGSRIIRRRATLRDGTPNVVSEGGFGYAAAVSGGRIVVSEPAGPTAFQGSQHRFAADGSFLGVTVAPWASRVVGSDVTDAGGGAVVVASMDDDAWLVSVGTGAFLRRYVADGSRTPSDQRQIVAAGPWILHGDPSNHLGGSFAGAVQVFDRQSAALVRTLLAPSPLDFSGFGFALAVLGDEPLIADGTGVHRYDPVTWVPTRTYPVLPGAPAGLAAAGGRILVGTDVNTGGPGHAVLLDADSGAEVRSLSDPLEQAGDLFGGTMASAAGAFVVGAAGAGWLLPHAGAVHVFDAASGERLHTILPPDILAGGGFGRAVAAGSDLIVATRLEGGWTGRGEAYVFTRRLLDAYACRAVRRGGVVSDGPSRRLVRDRFGAAPAALRRLTRVCRPVAADAGATQDPELLLTCYRAVARVPVPDEVVVRNALGTQRLALAARRTVCLPARAAAAP
jgi:cysteine-rich repeat protein